MSSLLSWVMADDSLESWFLQFRYTRVGTAFGSARQVHFLRVCDIGCTSLYKKGNLSVQLWTVLIKCSECSFLKQWRAFGKCGNISFTRSKKAKEGGVQVGEICWFSVFCVHKRISCRKCTPATAQNGSCCHHVVIFVWTEYLSFFNKTGSVRVTLSCIQISHPGHFLGGYTFLVVRSSAHVIRCCYN